MFKHLVYVNGRPFLVYTTTLDRAFKDGPGSISRGWWVRQRSVKHTN